MRTLQRLKTCLEISYQDYHALLNPSFLKKTLCYIFSCTDFLFNEMKILFLVYFVFYFIFLNDDKGGERMNLMLIYLILIPKHKHLFICSDIGDSENFENFHHVNQVFQVLRH